MPSCTGDFCFIFSWNVVALQCSVSFRGTNQPHEYIYSLLLGFPFHLGQRVTFCLLIQMLISSENSPTDTPRNYVLLEIQASFSPVRLGLKNKIKLYRWGTGGCCPSSLLHPGDWPVSMGIFFSAGFVSIFGPWKLQGWVTHGGDTVLRLMKSSCLSADLEGAVPALLGGLQG